MLRPRPNLCFILILPLIFFCAGATAQSSGTSGKHHFVYRSWNNLSGLPQNTVFDIAMDEEGYLWCATEEGLARFDGSGFTILNELNTPQLYSSTFYDLLPSGKGIWASSTNTILFIGKKGIRSYDVRNVLSGGWMECMEEDNAGNVWIGTSTGELLYLRNDTVRKCARWNPAAAGSVDALAFMNGTMYIGTSRGLFTMNETNQQARKITHFNNVPITCLGAGHRNEMWMGTASEGVFRIANGNIRQYTERDGLKESYISTLTFSKNGELWLGTRSSGYQIFNGSAFITPEQSDFLHDGVRAILPEKNNLVWLGTNSSGLIQVKPATIQMLSSDIPLSGDIVLAVYQHPGGDIWVGTAGRGVNRIRNGKVSSFTMDQGLANNLVLSLFGRKDFMYVGTSNGLNRFNLKENRFDRKFTTANGLSNNGIVALLNDSKNNLWITTRLGGVQKMDEKENIEQIVLPSSVGNSNIIGILEDSEGNIWMGSRGAGAVKMNAEGGFRHFSPKNEFPAEIVYGFYEDDQHTIWAATEKGLAAILPDGSCQLFTKKNGLRFNEMYRIMKDANGYLWLSGNFGLQRVALADAQEALALPEKQKMLKTRLFNDHDGMKNPEANGGFHPAGWNMQDGTLWFPTVNGIAIADHRRAIEDREPVNIHLQSLKYENTVRLPYEEIVVPKGVYNIEIHYTSIDFSKSNDINYHFRLKGLNDEWNEAGNRKRAYFSGLTPGTYTFEVKAERYGDWSPVATLTFSVQPFFYQTIWFKLALLGLLAAFILWLAWLQKKKSQQKIIQQQIITRAHLKGQEKERQVIGSELHDNINQQLTTAKIYLDLARGNAEMRMPMIVKSEEVVQNVINEIRSLCKSLTPHTLRDIGLEEAIQELAESYTLTGKFNVDYECTAHLEELDEDLRFSLFRIVQEQMTNITKHADADQVWIRIRSNGEQLFLTIKDNGAGFNPHVRSHGMGLANIRNRLDLYKGQMEIISAPGNGCTMKINVPLAGAV